MGARARSSPITAVWAVLKLVTDRRAGEENLTPPIRQLARALAPYSPQPPLPGWLSRGEACWDFPTFLRGCDPGAGTIQAACSLMSVYKVGKKLREAPLVEASPQTGEVCGAQLLETAPGRTPLLKQEGGVSAEELMFMRIRQEVSVLFPNPRPQVASWYCCTWRRRPSCPWGALTQEYLLFPKHLRDPQNIPGQPNHEARSVRLIRNASCTK